MSKHDAAEAAREAIPGVAAGVVETLGDGWAVDLSLCAAGVAVLKGPGRAELVMRVDQKDPRRVVVRTRFPRRAREVVSLDEARITIAADRGPEVIAKEIERRVLPGYLIELERGQDAIERSDQNERARAEAVARLIREAPVLTTRRDGEVRHWYGWGESLEMVSVVFMGDASRCKVEMEGASARLLPALLSVIKG